MNDVITIIDPGSDDDRISRIQGEGDGPVLGRWYWVLKNTDYAGKPKPDWLGCAMKVGSNFVEVHSPHTDRGYSSERIHFDEFVDRLRHEPKADEVIRARIGHWQAESVRLLADIERVTRSLGMTPQDKLGAPAAQGEAAGGALMVLSSQADPNAYSQALTVAKEETLPALFKEVGVAHGNLAKWMKAPVMSTLAQLKDQAEIVADIDDRIFSVSLYAGLTEDAARIKDGPPADMSDKLHVMQRMAYMDEECLANYRVGGMEFKDIGAFDTWLAEPENRDRILPFPRTLVAMRVRRSEKERQWDGRIRTLLVHMEERELDKATFLYIRNGEQLWRITTAVDFGALIFPDPTTFNPSEPKMMKLFCGRVQQFITVAEYEQRRDAEAERVRKSEEWEKARPDADRNPYWRSDHDFGSYRLDDWHPFNATSVYFDDATNEIEKQIKEYNRVALIIQGLFDRSMTLHPHPPARTWTAEGFDAAVKLVYDGTSVLHYGEPPDFEAYRARCNASLREGSTTVGQDDVWERHEGTKESARRDRSPHERSDHRPERYRPYGNPGPGYLARVKKWTRTGKATFEWEREKRSGDRYWEQSVACSITVPATELFHVDAYTPGDFRQFFADPRTRAEYLKWAPMLIAAEEWHHARAKLGAN